MCLNLLYHVILRYFEQLLAFFSLAIISYFFIFFDSIHFPIFDPACRNHHVDHHVDHTRRVGHHSFVGHHSRPFAAEDLATFSSVATDFVVVADFGSLVRNRLACRHVGRCILLRGRGFYRGNHLGIRLDPLDRLQIVVFDPGPNRLDRVVVVVLLRLH